MDSELFSMLDLYKSRDMALSAHEVAVILNRPDLEVSKPIYALYQMGYLCAVGLDIPEDGTIAVDTKLEITFAGEAALREHRRFSKNHFWTEFRAWITLAIALIALFCSILSLWLQWK